MKREREMRDKGLRGERRERGTIHQAPSRKRSWAKLFVVITVIETTTFLTLTLIIIYYIN